MAPTDTFVRQVKHTGRPVGDKHSDGQGLYLHAVATGKYRRMAYALAANRRRWPSACTPR